MSVLTVRQQEELCVKNNPIGNGYGLRQTDPSLFLLRRLAVLDYLHTNNLTGSLAAFGEETGLQALYVPDGKQRYSGLLEKKWTSVIRLQKKVTHDTWLHSSSNLLRE